VSLVTPYALIPFGGERFHTCLYRLQLFLEKVRVSFFSNSLGPGSRSSQRPMAICTASPGRDNSPPEVFVPS